MTSMMIIKPISLGRPNFATFNYLGRPKLIKLAINSITFPNSVKYVTHLGLEMASIIIIK